jgi:hypothetical protein
MKRMTALGLKYVEEPIVDKSEIEKFELVLYSGIACENSYVFPEDEQLLLKQLAGGIQLILNPDSLPLTPAFDCVRTQYSSIKKALELFK